MPRFPFQLTIVLLLICLPLHAASTAPLTRVQVKGKNATEVAAQLERDGYDILEGSVTNTTFEVVVSSGEVSKLRAKGLRVVPLAVGRPLGQIVQMHDGQSDIPNGYFDLDGIYQRMNEVAEAFPDIAQVVDISDRYRLPATFEGRSLFAMKISDNVKRDEDEPAVLIVSTHHAREIVTPVIALHAIDRLTQGYGTDPVISEAIDSQEIWIAPMWNPDGYNEVVVGDNLWRKNRRHLGIAIGVDQNRNYPQGWEASCAGSTSPISNTFKGPEAASEVETQTMMTWSLDRSFAKVVDFHSSGREVLYGYACLPHPFASWMEKEAAALARASGYAGATRLPSAEGEHYQWQFAQMGAWSHLIETQTSFQPPFATAQVEATMVWPGILAALTRAITLSGHVTDALTGAPVAAQIEVLDVDFAAGEGNRSNGRTGRYHFYAPPGTYRLRFAHPDYFSQDITFTIVDDAAAQIEDIQLQPMTVPPPEL